MRSDLHLLGQGRSHDSSQENVCVHAGRGWGLLTESDMQAGELLLICLPAIILTGNGPGSAPGPDDMAAAVAAAWEAASMDRDSASGRNGGGSKSATWEAARRAHRARVLGLMYHGQVRGMGRAAWCDCATILAQSGLLSRLASVHGPWSTSV